MTTSAVGATIPFFMPDEKRHRQNISEWAKAVNAGKIPVTGNVTLAAGVTTTVVTDLRAGINSHITLTPTTAKGASAASTVWISTFGKQTFTLTHAASGSTTKSFRYAILG